MTTKSITHLVSIVGLIIQREDGDIYYRLWETSKKNDPLWLKYAPDGNTLEGQPNWAQLDNEMLPLVQEASIDKLKGAMANVDILDVLEQADLKESLQTLEALAKRLGEKHGD